MTTAAEVYDQIVPFIWAAVDKKNGRSSGKHGWDNVYMRTYPVAPPFTFSFGRPAPTIKATNGRLMGAQPARDFQNPDYEWGHPTREDFVRAYAQIENYREYEKRRAKGRRSRRRWGFIFGFWRA